MPSLSTKAVSTGLPPIVRVSRPLEARYISAFIRKHFGITGGGKKRGHEWEQQTKQECLHIRVIKLYTHRHRTSGSVSHCYRSRGNTRMEVHRRWPTSLLHMMMDLMTEKRLNIRTHKTSAVSRKNLVYKTHHPSAELLFKPAMANLT